MATEPTATIPRRRGVWSAVAAMLLGAFLFGGWVCRFDGPGADPWSFGNMLLFVGSLGMVISGLLGLHTLTRHLVR
jgi:hypothetical protein